MYEMPPKPPWLSEPTVTEQLRRLRHCWVTADEPGRVPALLLEWRQTPSGWEARSFARCSTLRTSGGGLGNSGCPPKRWNRSESRRLVEARRIEHRPEDKRRPHPATFLGRGVRALVTDPDRSGLNSSAQTTRLRCFGVRSCAPAPVPTSRRGSRTKSLRSEVGMTGEVTRNGRVLPIGGLKQKLLAPRATG
jgi:hypothetical protein